MKTEKMGILYAVCVAVLLGTLVLIGASFKTEITQQRAYRGFQTLEDYKTRSSGLKDGKIETTYTFQALDVENSRESLWFYTIHQTVEVYIGGELLYSLKPSESDLFGRTPGNNWNEIPIYREDTGKPIRVVITSVYGKQSNNTPTFYFGDSVKIRRYIIQRNFKAFVLGILAMLVGIVLIVYGAVVNLQRHGDQGMVMMGAFSFFLGLWKASDLNMLSLILPNSMVRSNVAFVSLLLIEIPFALYAKGVFGKKDKLWYLPCFLNVGVIAVELGLQFAGIQDLRESLWMTHLSLAVLAATYLVEFFRELRRSGWNYKLKATAVCFTLCLLGMVADILGFYLSGGTKTTFLALTAYLIYVIVFGVISMKEVHEMVRLGQDAAHFKDLAFHDALTGIYSRAAYAANMEKNGKQGDGYCVVMMDLNSLKYCNDTYGHEQGDCYIRESARLILRLFGRLGNCYRIGGDEFCVCIKNVRLSTCAELVRELKEEIRKWNRENDVPFTMAIACGYAKFDRELDFSLYDTVRRADQFMYKEKFAMKSQCANV